MVNIILIAEFSGHGKHLRAGTLRVRQTTGRETQLLGRYFKVRLSFKLYTVFTIFSFEYHSKYGDFNYAETCVPKCQNCQKWDECCGEYPERYPFFSDYGNKGCCGQKTYYKSVLQCCKNDILQPKGTCQYGYGK